MKKKLRNVHPGELLREEFLNPLGITAYRLAKGARLPHQRGEASREQVADVLDPLPRHGRRTRDRDPECLNYESFCKNFGSCDGQECDYGDDE